MNLITLLITLVISILVVKITWVWDVHILIKVVLNSLWAICFFMCWSLSVEIISKINPAEYVGTKIVQSEYVRGILISDEDYKELPILFSQDKKVIFERIEPISINKTPNFWTFPFSRIYIENYWTIKEIK